MTPRKFATALITLVLALSLASTAWAITIGSFSSARSRAPLDSGSGSLSQEALRTTLIARGHTINAGVGAITGAALTGVNLFFTSVFTGNLSAGEADAINTYWRGGGAIFLETDSGSNERDPANSLLAALGVGTVFNGGVSGPNSATGGTIGSVNNPVTNGPNGDLRGLSYGISPTSAITLGADGAVSIATTDSAITMALYEPGDFCRTCGKLFIAGDPFTFNLFTAVGGSLYNPNNLNLALNVVDQVAQVPEPGTLLLLGSGLAVLGLWGRRTFRQKN